MTVKRPSLQDRRNPYHERPALLGPRSFGFVSSMNVAELTAICNDTATDGDLDAALSAYVPNSRPTTKPAFILAVTSWLTANQDKEAARHLMRPPDTEAQPKAAGTQNKRKRTPAPGTQGSVDLSKKKPRPTAGVSLRQGQPDRAARRAANRFDEEAE